LIRHLHHDGRGLGDQSLGRRDLWWSGLPNVVLTGRAVTFGTAVTMTNATVSNAGCN